MPDTDAETKTATERHEAGLSTTGWIGVANLRGDNSARSHHLDRRPEPVLL